MHFESRQGFVDEELNHLSEDYKAVCALKVNTISAPNLVIRVLPHEPAEQQVVIHLFHQQSFAADRVQHLQQLRPQQLLRRRNRRTADPCVHGVEPPGELPWLGQ